MDKIKKVLLTTMLVVITIILSTIFSVYAATTILGSEVSYTDTNDRLGASNVQAAIDATYNSANTLADNLTAIKTLYSYSGAIFVTTSSSINNTVLNKAFGGTWTKLTDDAYLKIVSSSAGTVKGTCTDGTVGTSSECKTNKIPIASMPSHRHTLNDNVGLAETNTVAAFSVGWNYVRSNTGVITDATGGGGAYYPTYLGIYVWKRS